MASNEPRTMMLSNSLFSLGNYLAPPLAWAVLTLTPSGQATLTQMSENGRTRNK